MGVHLELELLDHFNRLGEKRGRNFQSKRFRSFEIDEELYPCWHIVREVSHLCSLKEFVDIVCGSCTVFNNVNRICCKATLFYIFGKSVNRGQSIFLGKLKDHPPLRQIFRRRSHKEAMRTVLSHCSDNTAKFSLPERVIYWRTKNCHSQPSRYLLQRSSVRFP